MSTSGGFGLRKHVTSHVRLEKYALTVNTNTTIYIIASVKEFFVTYILFLSSNPLTFLSYWRVLRYTYLKLYFFASDSSLRSLK